MAWDREALKQKRAQSLEQQKSDTVLRESAQRFVKESYRVDYCYQWEWAGFTILQMPEDIVTYQEIMFRTKPSLVIETGVAWGGGIALLATVMSMYNPKGKVLGIDLNLDPQLQVKIDSLNMPVQVSLREGSSTADASVAWAKKHISRSDKVMVVLDSHHTHAHVLDELEAYAPIVTPGQFLVVGDTSVKDLAGATDRVRPWSSTDNPHTALESFLKSNDDFTRDEQANGKLLSSFHPGGYLIKNS